MPVTTLGRVADWDSRVYRYVTTGTCEQLGRARFGITVARRALAGRGQAAPLWVFTGTGTGHFAAQTHEEAPGV